MGDKPYEDSGDCHLSGLLRSPGPWASQAMPSNAEDMLLHLAPILTLRRKHSASCFGGTYSTLDYLPCDLELLQVWVEPRAVKGSAASPGCSASSSATWAIFWHT